MSFITIAALALFSGDEARDLFQNNCSACHVAPDPSLATDRAWIRQLAETT